MTSVQYSNGVGLAMILAGQEADLGGAEEIEPVHLLLGVCKACELPPALLPADLDEDLNREVSGMRARFEAAGLDTRAFRRRLRTEEGIRGGNSGGGPLHRSKAARAVLAEAEELAAAAGTEAVELSQLLCALLGSPSRPGARTAAALGIADRFALLPGLAAPRPASGHTTVPVPPSEEARSQVTLTVLHGPLKELEFPFAERTTCVIGRADDCTVRLPGAKEYSGVSRHHCLLDINPPHVRVRDLGSSNGTYVNGEELSRQPSRPGRSPAAERELHHGDELRLDTVGLRVAITVPARCGCCGRTVPDAEATRVSQAPESYSCPSCRTAAPPRTASTAGRTCAVCRGELPADSTYHPSSAELCPRCKGDPARVMKLLSQVVKDGSRRLYLFGGYTIERELGRGGMGAAYLARDRQTEELAAVKVMLPQAAASDGAKARFLREIDTVQMLRHPYLVSLHDHGTWNGIFYFAMDYCAGGDIAALVRRRGGRLPVHQAVGITLQVLEGLEYAHNAQVRVYAPDGSPVAVRGLVHRDLSPGNIFLDSGVARIGDFGLAKAFDNAGLSGLTHTGTRAGSVRYLSRQQVIEFKYARPQVDVWAAAACLYFMLTGTAPRDFPPGADSWQVVLESPAVPIRSRDGTLPGRLAKVVDHALLEEPEIGFATAEEFRQALLKAVR
ncbi:protein kinase [Spirillospora sp. NBC_00431]